MIRRLTTKSMDIARQLRSVTDRINASAQRRPENLQGRDPRLVAVSKTKPVEMIIEAYSAGQRHFGENYVRELAEKGNSQEIKEKCSEVKWHFIGHLQKNKINKVTSVPGLYMVETVESDKVAVGLNTAWAKRGSPEPLAVMVQVNTSGEENKNGVEPHAAAALCSYICNECPYLRLAGLMTIGSVESSTSDKVNPDFQCLIECRKTVAQILGLAEQDLELSMGMSQDFEKAVEVGSTNVRVGSTIFGGRQYPAQQTSASPSASNSSQSQASSSETSASPESSASPNVDKNTVNATATELDNLSLLS